MIINPATIDEMLQVADLTTNSNHMMAVEN